MGNNYMTLVKNKAMGRTYDVLTMKDLEQLTQIALNEQESFFKRNVKFSSYRHRLIGICLCQGAAAHYINRKTGIKDFDVWLFYIEDSDLLLWCRRVKTIKNGYMGKNVDILRRTIPKEFYVLNNNEDIIKRYISARNTPTKKELLKKASIGLYPDSLFNKVLWDNTNKG